MIEVLVTGAGGQLGQTFRELAKHYPEIRFIFTNSRQLDIRNRNQLRSTFSAYRFQYCINCAAATQVDYLEYNSKKSFEVNADAVKGLADTCRMTNTILIHPSTDYVFDGQKATPYRIVDATNPINVYGASKLKGEEYVQQLMKEFFVIRTSWVYSSYGKNFYKTILKKLKQKDPLYVVDDQYGCPTDTKVLATRILRLIEEKENAYGIHHYCGGEPMSWYDFAKRIAREHHFDVKNIIAVDSDYYKTVAKRPIYTVLENTL